MLELQAQRSEFDGLTGRHVCVGEAFMESLFNANVIETPLFHI